jgi:hypothetical protein
MKVVFWGLQLLIPLVVLYTIGYYLPGFSALTIPWIILLSVLVFLGNQLMIRMIGGITKNYARMVVHFIVATVIIFTLTLAIQGGSVPFGGAMIAAVIIAALTELVYPQKRRI